MALSKIYKLKPNEIAPIALGLGGCLATDRIVVDGENIGYMYRENPINTQDSGWRFFSGDEDSAYMENNDLHGVYDVNTIANYDPDIVPFLNSDYGSRFERNGSGNFRLLQDDE
ncbi:DUF2185 domain-containing protein [Novosphingobium beihaiensis]|uniref:DUF2185 domain-containing protein n=1 Tax=Novosphingobium beihaiensis TaxID=2930389 RepID=A0ABT0BPG2_9SPHN|nr:DUF2185 domain-containing protein [Novosphingobium beihaiensis]MCJ2186970.1 DUF2185 domain-containing protein [Novosphingobium beihaiensis]